MKHKPWPPGGPWICEEPPLNVGWSSAVSKLLARNCLLIGRKELCVIPEMLSTGTPDAGVVDK